MGRACANHKMVHGVLTEHQTSNCDVKCRTYYILISVEVSCIQASIRVENQYDDLVKVMQDSTGCFHLFRFYIHFIRQP